MSEQSGGGSGGSGGGFRKTGRTEQLGILVPTEEERERLRQGTVQPAPTPTPTLVPDRRPESK